MVFRRSGSCEGACSANLYQHLKNLVLQALSSDNRLQKEHVMFWKSRLQTHFIALVLRTQDQNRTFWTLRKALCSLHLMSFETHLQDLERDKSHTKREITYIGRLMFDHMDWLLQTCLAHAKLRMRTEEKSGGDLRYNRA